MHVRYIAGTRGHVEQSVTESVAYLSTFKLAELCPSQAKQELEQPQECALYKHVCLVAFAIWPAGQTMS